MAFPLPIRPLRVAMLLMLAFIPAGPSLSEAPDWHLLCNPDGNQPALNACAFAALEDAQAHLDDVIADFAQAYAHNPALQARRVAALDAAQALWEADRDRQLDALFPLAPGEDVLVMYGSSYPMNFSFAQAWLTDRRAEFLAEFWLPL